jgi:hypothetical protein
MKKILEYLVKMNISTKLMMVTQIKENLLGVDLKLSNIGIREETRSKSSKKETRKYLVIKLPYLKIYVKTILVKLEKLFEISILKVKENKIHIKMSYKRELGSNPKQSCYKKKGFKNPNIPTNKE